MFVSLFVLPALAPLGQLVAHGVVALGLVGSRLRLPWLLIFGWQPPGALVAVHAEAALPRHPDEPRVEAGGRGGREPVGTERGAAHGAVDAGAQVFTAGPEALPVLVDLTVVLAAPALPPRCGENTPPVTMDISLYSSCQGAVY